MSVIVPAYSARQTLPFALRSLLAQTWTKLEIIVIDDCSPDETFDVAVDFQRLDHRVRAVRQPHNRGAYAARNLGLELARGDLITTHDADDWSHPQKIQLQVEHLKKAPAVLANHTDWARSLSNLWFTGSFRPTQTLVQPSLSSTLFRREVFDRLGKWDEVRVAGDDELMWRLKRYAGPNSIERIFKGVPLAFSLSHEDSLTRIGLTHVRTVFYGPRREYCEAALHWHATSSLEQLQLEPISGARPFPAPSCVAPASHGPANCDLLFVGDFSAQNTTWFRVLNHINLANSKGFSTAIFHWPSFYSESPCRLHSGVRQLAHNNETFILSPGQAARTTSLIVSDPSVLVHKIDLFPSIEFQVLLVIGEDNLAEGETANERKNILKNFGTTGKWIAASQATTLDLLKITADAKGKAAAPLYCECGGGG